MQSAEIDDRIVDVLTKNADLTYKEIARQLGLNQSTVRKRILSLKRRGVIRRFMVEVDEESLGRSLYVSIALDIDPTKYMEVTKRLVVFPEIGLAFQASGGHDVFLFLWTEDRESLTRFIKKITSIDGITRVVPSFIVERLR
jgi:DNA-binding Lrp family transcriptional regulator